MTKTSAAQLRAQAKYDKTPAAKKRRARNNKARRLAQRQGWDHPGDGLDVAHLDNNSHNNSRKNLAHQKPSKNRSYDRTSTSRRARGKKK